VIWLKIGISWQTLVKTSHTESPKKRKFLKDIGVDIVSQTYQSQRQMEP